MKQFDERLKDQLAGQGNRAGYRTPEQQTRQTDIQKEIAKRRAPKSNAPEPSPEVRAETRDAILERVINCEQKINQILTKVNYMTKKLDNM